MDTGISDKVVWKNIYYMLIYSIEELENLDESLIDFESFDNIEDLLSELMNKSINILKENNYANGYSPRVGCSNKPKGRIDIYKSNTTGAITDGKLVYKYFEFNIDSELNRIIKSAVTVLIESGKLNRRNTILNEELLYELSAVSDIRLDEIQLDLLAIQEIQPWYRPAIAVARLIQENMIAKDEASDVHLFELKDYGRLKYIFENFVRNYLKNNYALAKVTRPRYPWGERSYNVLDMLLESEKTVLIVDCKWYSAKTMGNDSAINSNRLQLNEYMRSYMEFNEVTPDKRYFALALYGRTSSELPNAYKEIESRGSFELNNVYEVMHMTLDLDTDFNEIQENLLAIIDRFIVHQNEGYTNDTIKERNKGKYKAYARDKMRLIKQRFV